MKPVPEEYCYCYREVDPGWWLNPSKEWTCARCHPPPVEGTRIYKTGEIMEDTEE